MQLRYGLLAELEAAPGKGDALAAFLTTARETAAQESGTVTWYAFKVSDTTYGIFDTFGVEGARDAHLAGDIPVDLAAIAPRLLAAEPTVRTVDIVAFK
jgi:quinol monooxygenase YgiN